MTSKMTFMNIFQESLKRRFYVLYMYSLLLNCYVHEDNQIIYSVILTPFWEIYCLNDNDFEKK